MLFTTFIATNLTRGVICLRGKYEGLNNQVNQGGRPTQVMVGDGAFMKNTETAVILVASEK